MEDLNIYLYHLEIDNLNDNEINQAEINITTAFDLLNDNWKLIMKDQNSVKFDVFLKKINEYKNRLSQKLNDIKSLLIENNRTSNCRNSISTIESKTIFNTRRETEHNNSAIRNDSIVIRKSVFLNDNLTEIIKKKKELQVKLLDK